MNWHEDAPWARLHGAGETQRRADISDPSVLDATSSRKPTSPGVLGLEQEIDNTPTSELRQQVRILSLYGDVFGMAGARRRKLAVLELGRRMAVPR